jgi:choline dehydrogenase-like flavoprotein
MTLRNLVFEEKLFGARLKEKLTYRITRQFRVSYSTETLPNPNNRVMVSDKVDGLNVPRPKIHFELDDYNRRAFEVGRQVIWTIFQALKATEMKFASDPNAFSSANHIMGTCRMGNDPKTSVVDAECRAHDHPNLFILGASVFPTCGTANPTLAVVALALRAVGAIRSQLQAERGR